MRVSVNAPAKVNLSLNVVGRRADGYHLLKMVTQSVDLADTVTVSNDGDDSDVPVRLSCDVESVPTDESNIVVKAAKCFFEETEIKPEPITVKIKKRIPVAGGLGGGSADAAAVIVALNELFDAGLSMNEMCDIGELVGSDVPACLIGGTALVEGTGSLVNPLPDLDECFFVLAYADNKTSTKDMYDKIDIEGDEEDIDTNDVVDEICSGNLEKACRHLYNSFEKLWSNTNVPRIKETMLDCGAMGAGLTGSGPTVFGIFEERSDASDCAAELKKFCDDVFVCEPCEKGSEID